MQCFICQKTMEEGSGMTVNYTHPVCIECFREGKTTRPNIVEAEKRDTE